MRLTGYYTLLSADACPHKKGSVIEIFETDNLPRITSKLPTTKVRGLHDNREDIRKMINKVRNIKTIKITVPNE